MPFHLCALLWAVPGREAELSAYEDTVLALLPRYGARVVSRVRRIGDQDGPLEVQVIELPDEAALEAYLADPARVTLAATHRAVIERTEVIRVSLVDAATPSGNSTRE
jgi:uncharacterized protein (DUF1330 family)